MSFDDLDGIDKSTIKSMFKIDDSGISSYTMAQTEAKAKTIGLTDSLKDQLVAMSQDADLATKAKVSNMTWADALKDGSVKTNELVNALKESDDVSNKAKASLRALGEITDENDVATKHLIDQIINGSGEFDNISDKVINFGEKTKESTSMLSATKDTLKGLFASIKGYLPIIAAVAAAIAAYKIWDYTQTKYTRAQEKLSKSSGEYEETKSELESLNNELETTTSRIEELQKLQKEGTITLTEEAELEKLQQTNSELERQVELKKAVADVRKKQVAEDLKTASQTEESYTEHMRDQYGKFLGTIMALGQNNTFYTYDKNGKVTGATTAAQQWKEENGGSTTITSQVTSSIKKLDEFKKNLADTEEKLAKDPTNKTLINQQKNWQDQISQTTESISTQSEVIQGWIDSAKDENGNILSGMEDSVREWNTALTAVQNMGKTAKEIDLNNMNNFLNNNQNAKKYFDSIIKNGGSAQDVLEAFKETGLSLSDIGVSNESFIQYFNELAAAANNATDAIEGTNNSLTISDVEEAFSSANPGDDYVSLYDYLGKAKDLYNKGLVGTDDFKSVAELISYNIDSSTESFKKNYDKLQRYFTTNDDGELTAGGIKNFLNDLKSLNKGYAEFDENTGKWTLNMDNTAQAAKDMGLSVQSFESMLGRVQDYDNVGDFKFTSAVKQFNEAKDALDKLQESYDSMVDSPEKEQLKLKLDQWTPQIESAENDLASLPQEVITQIKFEYDKSQLQQLAKEAYEQASNGGFGDIQSNASAITAGKNYQDKLKGSLDFSSMNAETIPVYFDAENAIANLKQQLKSGDLSEDEVLEVQGEVVNLQQMQNQILEAFSNAHPEITPETDVTTANKTFEEWINSTEGKKAIVDIQGDNKDVLDKVNDLVNHDYDAKVKVAADTSDAESKLQDLNGQSVENKTVSVNGDNSDAESKIRQVTSDGKSLEQNPFITYVHGDNTDANNKISDTEKKVGHLTAQDWQVYVQTYANDNVIVQLINKLSSWFTKVKAGLFSATVSTSTSGSTPSTGSNSKNTNSKYKAGVAKSGYDQVRSGGSHLSGTTKGSVPWISQNGKTKSTQKALVGEQAPELVVNGNRWWTVGNNGAEFTTIPKGSVVFDAYQTKELLSNGFTNSRASGNALLGGTAYLGTGNGSFKIEDHEDNSSSKSKSGSSSTKSSKKSSGSGSSNTSSSSSTDEAEKTKETLDWIETKISRVERVIKNLGKTVAATYKSWSERNQALYQEYSAVNGEIVDQQNAYERYLQEANNVGLDAGYAQLVRDGKIDIETITDDDLKQKIEDYKNWYEKALDCSDAILDLKDNLYDLLQTNFDSITKQFEDQLDVISHSVNMVEGYIDLAETRGYLASTDYYNSLINLERQNIGTLQNEYNSLATTLNNMVNAGQIEKYSEAWYDLYGQICDVEESWQDATKALSEYESKMRELKWSYFEKEQDYITNFTDEMSWLNDLLEKQGKLIDDNGNMTNRGTASMGLHAVGYNTYMSQADDYAKEIQKINEELAKDPFNTILIDKRQEYLKAQRDSIDAAYDEIDAAKSLMKDKYDAELDAIDKLIEKRKDAMSTERDLYNYQKSISEKVNSLSSLEKQRKAYEKDNSEEGMAKRQQLDKSIKDAKTDLQETEWDQQISDVEQMMDNMRDDYEQMLNDRLDNLEFIMNEMLSSANENSESIKTTLTEATASVGTTLSDTMANIWNSNSGLNGIVTGYSNTFSTALTTTNAALASIETMIKSMVQEAQRKAAEDAAMQQQMAQATQAQQPTVPQTTQNQTTTAPQQVQNTGLDTGFFIYKQNSYPVSKLNVNSSIIDRLRWKNFDESFSARSSYYAAMNNGDEYTGSASQNVKMLNWMKQNGFSTGGEITDLIGHTKDDGWALVGKKETIIDQQATQNLKDAIQMLNPLQNFINSMTTATIPNVPSTMSQNFENHIDVQMNFPNAKNYEEIKNALLVDNNFEKTMTQAILGGAMGQNSLKKRSMIK